MRLRKQLASGVLAAMLVLSGIVPSTPVSAQSAGVQIYVSPNGDDDADGSLQTPLRTLEGARDMIRDMKSSGLPAGGVTVNLRGGTYSLVEQSFELTEEDSGTAESPIVYQSYPGETAVISGSVQADGAHFEPVSDQAILDRLPEESRDHVLVYDVTERLGISSFSPIPKNGYGWPDQSAALSISVDGEAQTLARYPNTGFINISSVQDKGFVPRSHMTNPDGTCPECTKLYGGGNRIPCTIGEENWINQPGGVWTVNNLGSKYDLWSQESDIWMSGYFCWAYADDNVALKSLEKSGSGLKMSAKQPSRYGVGGGDSQKFYVYNLLCEIDVPGEWYLDRETGKLYLYPEKDLSGSTVELSMMGESFIRAENVQYVQFKNLEVTKGNSHGIELVNCHHTLVAGCSFTDLGQRAVVVGTISSAYENINTGANGGSDNTIESCDIKRTGQGGVYLGGGNRFTLTPGNNCVKNCDFEDFSVTKRTYSPAVAIVGCGNTVYRNKMYNAPHMAISYDGNDHTIFGNEIFNVCTETSDVGAIYSVRTWSYRGVEIKNNYIHDLTTSGGTGSAAVYVDDMTSGALITNNLFVNISGYTALMGGGRDNHFQNNVQINSGANGKGIHHDNRGEGWAMNAGSVPDGNNYAEWAALKSDERFDESVWREKYPELMDMSLRTETRSYGGKTYEACVDALMPEDAVITDNVLVGVANPLGNISARVKELGTVEDNTTFPAGTDIGFVNADGQNFEVRADSKIKELLGDEHFQASEAGLYVDEYRTNLGVPVTAPTAKSPENNAEVSIASGVTFSWQAGEGAGSYLLEISESDDFESLAFSASTRQTSLRVLDLEKKKQNIFLASHGL